MTSEGLREFIRTDMEECPACSPESADAIPDADLAHWLQHGRAPAGSEHAAWLAHLPKETT